MGINSLNSWIGNQKWNTGGLFLGLALVVSACGQNSSSDISGVVTPAYSSITPTSAALSDSITFSLNGSNLPSSGYSATIGDNSPCASPVYVNASLVQVTCSTPSSGSTALLNIKRNNVTINSLNIALLAATYTSVSPTNVPLNTLASFAITGQRIPTALYSATLGTTPCEAAQSSSTLINVSCAVPASGSSETLTLKNLSGTVLLSQTISYFAQAAISSVNPATVFREQDRAFAISGVNFNTAKAYTASISVPTIPNSRTCSSVVVTNATTLTATCLVPTVLDTSNGTAAILTVNEDGSSLGTLPITILYSGSNVSSSISSVSPASVPQSSIKTYTITGTNFSTGDSDYAVKLNGVLCTSVSATSSTQLTATCTAPGAGATTDMVIFKGDPNNINHQLGTKPIALTTTTSIASVAPLVAVPSRTGVKFTFTGNNLSTGTNLYDVALLNGSTTIACRNVSVLSSTSLTAECDTPDTSVTYFPTFKITKRTDSTTVDGTGSAGVVKVYLSTITKITASPKMFTVYRNPADRPTFSSPSVTITVEATGGLSDSTVITATPICPSWQAKAGGLATPSIREYTCVPVNAPSSPLSPTFYTFQDGVQGFKATMAVTTDTGYTKVNALGEALPSQAGTYANATDRTTAEAAGTYWNCVRDNKYNLIWKINTTDGLFANTFLGNIGTFLTVINQINELVENPVCGKSATNINTDTHRWRFPTWKEMGEYLINVQNAPAIINRDYFPNISTSTPYWTYGKEITTPSVTLTTSTPSTGISAGLYDSSIEFANISTNKNPAKFCSFDLSTGIVEPVYSTDSFVGTTPSAAPVVRADVPSWCGVTGNDTNRTPTSRLLPFMLIRYGE